MAQTIKSLNDVPKVIDGSLWAGTFVVEIQDDVLADDFTFEALMRALPLDWQAKILNKKSFHDRCASLCNQLLQLFGCSIMTGSDFRELKFDRGSFGKPFLDNDNSLPFSMSTGEQCVAMSLVKCVSPDECQKIGIDIASTSNYGGKEELELFREIFSEEEFRALLRASNPRVVFTYLWSLKESYTKFTGTGLNTNLAEIDFGSINFFPANGTSLNITLEKLPLVFHSQWFNNEIITTCIPRSISNNINMDTSELYNISLSTLIEFFIKN
ncbi:holo-[acyl-carrier-protein] synthase SKDI_07G1080 [Saccharomyces kudriavzevii IFO 1802]|uniref:LYS5-like protein n=2 Tax=Saccharomyces kudriavzevii (strain ATCC MYA-4449 / AS 2.2408 / CBS 8840 / NBRC 1802 / NCYC 2889) TaxID=226230 RepID=J6EL26_SACK1|nr:uncharacterized protein SKDI_07G1080 [Saccharomyces kudriavzevii IFO 1802]EJT43862.1 LYS5-like protein [Saccharomyces kudriavzevii IFO 1802]CAI4061626.1 hypothetical protein SKDI_07G1080 [Saccharomyces kudriavzevii IFO 1802]